MELQHNGIKVTLNEANAKFEATINGRKVSAPSFDAMKRAIDKAEVFPAFKIIRVPPYYIDHARPIEEDEVVALARQSRGYGRGAPLFKTKKGQELRSVIEDTPENRKAVAAFIALQKEHAKIQDAHKEAERKAEAAIPCRHADKEAGK